MTKRWKITTWILVALVLLFGLGYAKRHTLIAWGYDTFIAKKVDDSFANSYNPLKNKHYSKNTLLNKPFSLLLLGVDARAKERGRSDTIIFSVVRPQDEKVLMVSIPRDTYSEIVGKNHKDKLTHAYAFGGANMAVKSVEKLLGEKVNHYASINFTGFRKAIDTLGGVSLPITKDIENKDPNHEKFFIKANKDLYNGTEALNFVRYREDAGGDMARTDRNRIFLEALLERGKDLNQWSKIPTVLKVVGKNFRTDLTTKQINYLAKQFLKTNYAFKSYMISGQGERMGKDQLWYYKADEKSLATARKLIQNWSNPNISEEKLSKIH